MEANTKKWRNAEIPAANGHATSRGIAKFYSLLANDSEDNFLSIETIECNLGIHCLTGQTCNNGVCDDGKT